MRYSFKWFFINQANQYSFIRRERLINTNAIDCYVSLHYNSHLKLMSFTSSVLTRISYIGLRKSLAYFNFGGFLGIGLLLEECSFVCFGHLIVINALICDSVTIWHFINIASCNGDHKSLHDVIVVLTTMIVQLPRRRYNRKRVRESDKFEV